ncbi:MAG: exosortase-associated EpsI family protein, partial [Planctomycetaceae bacterium]|nr:exosortase-associated EpsI family protein [Planctomycetaceae bacterium]
MKNPISAVAALALIVGSGLIHGTWTNRWRTAPALAELAARLDSVPTVLGDWTATAQAIPPRQMAIAGAVGQISRVYTNPTKGLTVSVLLLCGLPGNISTHTPDVCYPGA